MNEEALSLILINALEPSKLGVFPLHSSRGQQLSVNETTGGARRLQDPNLF